MVALPICPSGILIECMWLISTASESFGTKQSCVTWTVTIWFSAILSMWSRAQDLEFCHVKFFVMLTFSIPCYIFHTSNRVDANPFPSWSLSQLKKHCQMPLRTGRGWIETYRSRLLFRTSGTLAFSIKSENWNFFKVT